MTEQFSTIGLGATLLAGLGALVIVWGAIRLRWRETLGRRRNGYTRLARLGTGAHLSFFVAVLGEPPAMRSSIAKDGYVEFISSGDPAFDPALAEDGMQERYISRSFLVSTFIDRDYYVQTITDDDETVLAFSVTTRSKRFRPVYQGHRQLGPLERWRWRRRFGRRYQPIVNIKLGRTTFADLDSSDADTFVPPHFKIMVGAHNHTYSEFKYFGNPGNYQSFVWTASDAARQGRFGNGMAVWKEIGGEEWPDSETAPSDESAWPDMVETQRFRNETVITTYTVIGQRLSLSNYPLERFGPHENEVRTLP